MNDVVESIKKAISQAQDQHKTRENALVVTKLEEALMWQMKNLENMRAQAQKHLGQAAQATT